MTQTNFARLSPLGFPGQTANTRDIKADPKLATAPIEFGVGVAYDDALSATVSTVGINKIILTNSGDLDASDTFSFNLKIKNQSTGVEVNNAMASGVFDTTDAITIGKIVTAAKLLTGIASTSAYLANVLTLNASPGYTISIDSVVYGGGSSITETSKVNSDTRAFAGLALHEDKEMFSLDGDVTFISRYKTNDVVNVATFAEVLVNSPSGFAKADTLYFVGSGAYQGQFTKTAGDTTIAMPAAVSHDKDAVGATSVGSVKIK